MGRILQFGKGVRLLLAFAFLCLAACAQAAGTANDAASPKAGGPKLGEPGMGSPIDKSGDATLAQLIADVAPKFKQDEFRDGETVMGYNLFTPKTARGKKYPLVLFIADASTPGKDVKAPLVQGYGALVWADAKSQAKNPCFVLVPQFSGVAVNDLYEHTAEVESVLKLLDDVIKNNPVDPTRVYVTGQSMGGMIGMYYNIVHPGIFAASLFVDCHWDKAGMDKLVEHPFIFIYAGNKGKSWPVEQEIEAAARRMGVNYTWSEWSARLPQKEQDELCATMLAKGQPINLIGFEEGTVLPESGRGSEHMYSFDHAYKLAPAREWLFKHKLGK